MTRLYNPDKSTWNTYIFHRKEGFYPVELPDDECALESVPINPGTLKVERIDSNGRIVILFPQ